MLIISRCIIPYTRSLAISRPSHDLHESILSRAEDSDERLRVSFSFHLPIAARPTHHVALCRTRSTPMSIASVSARVTAPPSARARVARRRASLVRVQSSADGAGDTPFIDRKSAQEAARKALQGALGGKAEKKLRALDGGGPRGPIDWFFGGGGGGGGGDGDARKIAGWIFIVFAVLTLFKPVTAIAVNAMYYAFGWRTGREAPTEAELASANAPADASVIAKYAADDDDDDDDDDDGAGDD